MKIKSIDFQVRVEKLSDLGVYLGRSVEDGLTIKRSVGVNDVRARYADFLNSGFRGKEPELMGDGELAAWFLADGVCDAFDGDVGLDGFTIEFSDMEALKDALLRKFISDCIYKGSPDFNIDLEGVGKSLRLLT